MSDLDQLTQVIQVILSNDNQARIQGENLLLSLRQGDFNSYVITFANLLNGINLISSHLALTEYSIN
jgi:hypothetical protein